MKKRLLAALLTAALAPGTLPAAGAAVDSSDASAYLKVMDNIPNASSYLVDFDGDGSDELVLVWGEDEPVAKYEVWRGSARLVQSDRGPSGTLSLAEKDGRIYLTDYTPIGGDEIIECFTINAGTWTLTDKLVSGWSEGLEQYSCQHNGSDISREEFENLWNAFRKTTSLETEGHSVRNEVLAALSTTAGSYKDVLSTLSTSERRALFDDFLYCVAGIDGSSIFPNNPSRGFDSRTASDGEIVSLLEDLRMDTQFPISADPFPQEDFTRLTQRYFGRTIDYSKFAADHQPASMDYGYENLYYDGVFYLCWPQRGSNVSLEDLSGTPKQLYSLGSSWYCANFTITTGHAYSAVVKRNADDTWQLVRLYPANYTPTETELAAFVAPSSWAQAEISAADAAGLIPELNGAPGWQDNTTRLQFAQLAVRLAEKATGKTLPAAPNSTFTDCTDADVLKAYAAGIVNGTSDTTFSPDSKLTREQLATMLWRAAAYIQEQTGEQALTASSSLTGYADANQVSAYAKEAVASLAQHGIMKGTSATKLAPQENCSVEQSVLLTYRMMQKLS